MLAITDSLLDLCVDPTAVVLPSQWGCIGPPTPYLRHLCVTVQPHTCLPSTNLAAQQLPSTTCDPQSSACIAGQPLDPT